MTTTSVRVARNMSTYAWKGMFINGHGQSHLTLSFISNVLHPELPPHVASPKVSLLSSSNGSRSRTFPMSSNFRTQPSALSTLSLTESALSRLRDDADLASTAAGLYEETHIPISHYPTFRPPLGSGLIPTRNISYQDVLSNYRHTSVLDVPFMVLSVPPDPSLQDCHYYPRAVCNEML